MEVVEFIVEWRVEAQQSGRKATLRPVNWLVSSRQNTWEIWSTWKGMVRWDQAMSYSQAQEWFLSCTTALTLLCSTSYTTLDFPPCWLQVAFAVSVTWIYENKTLRENYIQEAWSFPGIWKNWHFSLHGPLEPVKRSEIKGYWPVDFLETQRAPRLQPLSSSHNTGIIKVLQVTDPTAYEIRKINGKFTMHFILLQLSLNKLLRNITNWKSLWRARVIPLQEILENIL